MKSKKILSIVALMIFTLASIANVAFAECIDDIEVSTSNSAEGTNCPSWEGSPSNIITCEYFVDLGGVERGYCRAYNGSAIAECTTTDPKLLRVIASINPGSYIRFNSYPNSPNCRVISTQTAKW